MLFCCNVKNPKIIDGEELWAMKEATGIRCLSDECDFTGDDPQPDSLVWLACSDGVVEEYQKNIAECQEAKTDPEVDWDEWCEYELQFMKNDLACIMYVREHFGITDAVLIQL